MDPPLSPEFLCKIACNYGVLISDEAQLFAVNLLKYYDSAPVLEFMEVTGLLKAASKHVNPSLEEKFLDRDEYGLDFAFVQIMELRREMSRHCKEDLLPQAEEQLLELTRKWSDFTYKWSKAIKQQRRKATYRLNLLQHLRDSLNLEVAEDSLELPPYVNDMVNNLQKSLNNEFLEKLTVKRHDVAQVASELSGFPERCFYPFSSLRGALRVQTRDITQKLSKNLIGLGGATDIIGYHLSKVNIEDSSPLGSFLLLGPQTICESALVKALAKEIYGDEKRFIALDVSSFDKDHHATAILCHLLTNGNQDRSKKTGRVVLFRNCDDICTSTRVILQQIITDGRLGDEEESLNFCNDIILITSDVGKSREPDCECIRSRLRNREFQSTVNFLTCLDDGISTANCSLQKHEGTSTNICSLQKFYDEVKVKIETEFRELFTDLIVFPISTLQNCADISRLQLRDVAETMSMLPYKKVILYASDSAVQKMVENSGSRVVKASAWSDLLRPTLDEHASKAKMIIYIDLDASEKFCFRVENVNYLEQSSAYKRFKDTLSSLRSMYLQEKLLSNSIIKLKAMCYRVCDLMAKKHEGNISAANSEAKRALQLIDSLIQQHSTEVNLDDDAIIAAEASVKLQWLLEQEDTDKALRVIIKPLLRCLREFEDEKSKAPAECLLCLGLTSESANQFAETLENQFLLDDKKQLVIRVDLAQCTERSFSQCRTSTNQLLTEVLKRIPVSIVVFHRPDWTDESVSSNILSILKRGVAEDSEGNSTSYRKSVVIIISPILEREFISRLMNASFVHRSKVETELKKQGLKDRLVCQLGLWLFGPDNQLKELSMLPRPLKKKVCSPVGAAAID